MSATPDPTEPEPTDPQPVDPPPVEDGFPKEGDGAETIRYMAGGRFSGGPITRVAAPGPVVGDLIARLARLFSALEGRGANLARAAGDYPYYLRGLAFEHSVDVLYQGERRADATLVDQTDDPVRQALEALSRLTAERDGIQEIAAEYGGAVTTAYRQLASLLGQRGITADFFIAVDEVPDDSTFVRLPSDLASVHAEALSDQETLRIETVTLTGILTVLDGLRGTFKLMRPNDLQSEYKKAWRAAVGAKRTLIEGEMTDEAETDIRRFNAWKSQVTVEVELTHMTAPKSTSKEEVEARLLRISQHHMRLTDDAASAGAVEDPAEDDAPAGSTDDDDQPPPAPATA